jgi:hypothetical protein
MRLINGPQVEVYEFPRTEDGGYGIPKLVYENEQARAYREGGGQSPAGLIHPAQLNHLHQVAESIIRGRPGPARDARVNQLFNHLVNYQLITKRHELEQQSRSQEHRLREQASVRLREMQQVKPLTASQKSNVLRGFQKEVFNEYNALLRAQESVPENLKTPEGRAKEARRRYEEHMKEFGGEEGEAPGDRKKGTSLPSSQEQQEAFQELLKKLQSGKPAAKPRQHLQPVAPVTGLRGAPAQFLRGVQEIPAAVGRIPGNLKRNLGLGQ